MNKNIILCGFMGSGKSVTGKALAKRLNMEFIDLDQYIEQNAGLTVNSIFEKFGEAHFRNLENEAAKKLGGGSGRVIACGGGTVLNPKNVEALKANGIVFYLSVTPETVKARLKNDNTRPLLAANKEQAVYELLKAREPIYLNAADITVNSNGSIDDAVEQILKHLS